MNPLLDTIMNLEVFIFIGLMVWLYLRPADTDGQEVPRPDDPNDVKPEV